MERKVWKGRYGKEGMERKVWKGRYGKEGMERKVWKGKYRKEGKRKDRTEQNRININMFHEIG